MKNLVNKRYVPKLRFKGFTQNLENFNLKDFGESNGGTSLEKFFNKTGKYKVINIGSYTNDNKYRDQGIRIDLNDKSKNKILNKNDLVMVLNDKTPSGNIIGRVILIDENNKYVYNQRSQRIIVKKEFDSKFLFYFLNQYNNRKKIIARSKGNTQIYINWKDIETIKYFVPTSLKEQEKISKFLSLLDKQISLLENKLKLTEILLKFSINNFFKIASNKFKFIIFEKFVTLNKNKNKSNIQYDVATISNKFGFIKQNDYFDDKTIIASENKKNYYIVEKNTFGFNPARINVGSFGYYKGEKKLLISPIYVSFKVENKIFLDEIIEAYSKTHFFKKNIEKWQTGSVRKSINGNDFLNFTISSIPLEIQGEFIKTKFALEKYITNLTQKIEILKLRRNFYLENLFI